MRERQEADDTSLGIFRPREVTDLVVTPDESDWKQSFLDELRQTRLWDTRTKSKEPPRKVPWRFQYRFRCDDTRCKGHKMTNEDWEVGALYWNLVDRGATPEEAAAKVKIDSSRIASHLLVEAMEICGGVACLDEFGLSRHHNDLFVTRVGEGSNRALMTFAVRPLLKDCSDLLQ